MNSYVCIWIWNHIIIWIHTILYDDVKIKRETNLWHSGRHRCIGSIRGDGKFHISNSGGGYQWGRVWTGGAISYSRDRCLWGGGLFWHDGDVNSYKAVNWMAAAMELWLTRQWIGWWRQWSYGVCGWRRLEVGHLQVVVRRQLVRSTHAAYLNIKFGVLENCTAYK